MDRASILGDAIEYLKELLQRINDLHNELESTPSGSSLPSASSFHPLTPTPATLPCRVKEELCPSSLPSPNNQPARVNFKDSLTWIVTVYSSFTHPFPSLVALLSMHGTAVTNSSFVMSNCLRKLIW